jgi:hypothetical protein
VDNAKNAINTYFIATSQEPKTSYVEVIGDFSPSFQGETDQSGIETGTLFHYWKSARLGGGKQQTATTIFCENVHP